MLGSGNENLLCIHMMLLTVFQHVTLSPRQRTSYHGATSWLTGEGYLFAYPMQSKQANLKRPDERASTRIRSYVAPLRLLPSKTGAVW